MIRWIYAFYVDLCYCNFYVGGEAFIWKDFLFSFYDSTAENKKSDYNINSHAAWID